MIISDEQLLEDVFHAYYEARRHKRNKLAQLEFEIDLEHNLVGLFEEIRDRRYKPSPGVVFIVNRPVKREIYASKFKDRVVHHLLYYYLMPFFEPLLIEDSYSCRVGRGTSEGLRRLRGHIRSCSDNYRKNVYVLQLDIRGYFMSIDKGLLYDIIVGELERRERRMSPFGGVWGERLDYGLVKYLLTEIIFRDPTEDCEMRGSIRDWDGLPDSKSLLKSPKGVGLPIGDLTSQLFSNIYLSKLDDFIKRECGCRHYGRYVDDFYVVDERVWRLKELVPVVGRFLRDSMHLVMHPDKVRIQRADRGICFLGACVKPYRSYPTRRSRKLFVESVEAVERRVKGRSEFEREELEYLLSVVNSHLGHIGHLRAYRLIERFILRSAIAGVFDFRKRMNGGYVAVVRRDCVLKSGRRRKGNTQ